MHGILGELVGSAAPLYKEPTLAINHILSDRDGSRVTT